MLHPFSIACVTLEKRVKSSSNPTARVSEDAGYARCKWYLYAFRGRFGAPDEFVSKPHMILWPPSLQPQLQEHYLGNGIFNILWKPRRKLMLLDNHCFQDSLNHISVGILHLYTTIIFTSQLLLFDPLSYDHRTHQPVRSTILFGIFLEMLKRSS